MVTNDQSFEVSLTPDSINTIEQLVDTICDQLFINETYYGNILMAMTEMFGLMTEKSKSDVVNITYKTDYQNVAIYWQPVDTELINKLKTELEIENVTDDLQERGLYLVRSLVDEIEFPNEDSLSFNFDISALHDKIYKQRENLLQDYFLQTKKDKVTKRDDQL